MSRPRLQVGSGRVQGRQLQGMPAQGNVLQGPIRQEDRRGQPHGQRVQETGKAAAHQRTRDDAPQQTSHRTRGRLWGHQVQSRLQAIPAQIEQESEGRVRSRCARAQPQEVLGNPFREDDGEYSFIPMPITGIQLKNGSLSKESATLLILEVIMHAQLAVAFEVALQTLIDALPCVFRNRLFHTRHTASKYKHMTIDCFA